MSGQGPYDEPGAGAFENTPPHGQPPVQRRWTDTGGVRLDPGSGDFVEGVGDPDSDMELDGNDEAVELPSSRESGQAREPTEPREPRGPRDPGERVRGPARSGTPARVARHASAARRRRARLTGRGAALLVVLVLVLVLGGAIAWYEIESNPFGSPGKPVVVHVSAGETMGSIVGSLIDHRVIGSSLAFHLWSVVHGAPVVRPGLYQLHENLSFSSLSSALAAGPNIDEVNVFAGTTIAEVASQLASLPGKLAQSFRALARSGAVPSPYQPSAGTSLEGLIAPGTYRITPGETARTLLSQMVARFDATAEAAGLSPTTSVDGLSAYDLVIVASVAQKEGYFTRYMGDVARVIYNRLSEGMALDMTSTILYTLGKDGGPVTAADEEVTSPYNTYLHTGLTPTPICTPSSSALAAAVAPPQGPWLYFELVTAKKGTMVFSATYTQQIAAEQQAGSAASSPATTTASRA